MNTVNALLVDGDTVGFRGGLTYSGSTQYLNNTRKRITYIGNGATISGFTFKLNGGATTVTTGYCTFRGFNFSGAGAGIVLDNTFAPTIEFCNFDTNAVGVSIESSAGWTELWCIRNTHFNDCTKSLLFKTPTGTGTGSYINGTLDHSTFNSSAIATAYTFIECQATTEISESRFINSRLWFNAAGVVGTGINLLGTSARAMFFKPFFENFSTATNTVGITIGSGSGGGIYFIGRPVFAGAGTWTSKIANASNKYILGTVNSWRESSSITPSATINTYGTAVTVLNGQVNADWGGIPNLYVTIGGTVGATETVTVEITLNTYSAWTPVLTKTYTATGTYPLTLADYLALLSNSFYFVADNFSVRAKSSIASTIATVAFGGFEGGTAIPDTVVNTDVTKAFTAVQQFNNHLDLKTITAPSSASAGFERVYARAIDANNDGLFIKVKKAGSVVEVQIA